MKILEFDLAFEQPPAELAKAIRIMRQERIDLENSIPVQEAVEELQMRTQEIYTSLSSRQTLQVARHEERPHAIDYISLLCDDFLELHGDRTCGDNTAFVGGLATFNNQTVLFLAHQKGYSAKEQPFRNFGLPHPEEYRKACRLMQMAGKFNFPVICLIDTPGAGAFPTLIDEEQAQARAIASNLALMARLPVPILAVVISEGDCGSALGIGVADRLLMFEHSVYTVVAPEAASSILWHDNAFASQPTQVMRIGAREALATQIIDGLIPEPIGGAHHNSILASSNLQSALKVHLWELTRYSPEQLIEMRYQKFRRIGCFSPAV